MRPKVLVRTLLLAALIYALPVKSSAGIILSVTIAPPPLPIYEQPFCPGEGYIWTPGYWAYGDDGFFWVPGTWVLAPEPGLLWTPGYWGWGDGVFLFHEGYWGPRVGFYGGIVYGFGYDGFGYEGGYWNGGAFYYNRSVNNVRNITNVYNKTVIVNNTTINNVSYNGGAGGVQARPTAADEAALRERRLPPTRVQTQHVQVASADRQLYESANHGKPPIAATVKPDEFRGHGVIKAQSAARAYMPPTARSFARPAAGNTISRPASPIHANQIPRVERPNVFSTGNPKQDQKYQQEQQKFYARQDQERMKLEQKQQEDHQRMIARSNNNRSQQFEQRQQQLEQRHQQQTQQLEQRQTRETQRFQERMPQPNRNPRR